MRPLMPPVQTPDNLFHDGNPLTGELGTIVDAEHLNNVQGAVRDAQSELITVLNAAGINVDPSKQNQLLTALKALLLSRSNPFGDIKSDGTVKTALENLGLGDLGTASRRNVGTGANQIPDMSSFASTLNMPGVARFPGGFKLMWVLGNTNSSGAADVVFPTSFDVFGLGAVAIERNPYAWGAGISNTWAIQLSTLTKTGVQAICREDNGSRISAVENAGCIVFAWGK